MATKCSVCLKILKYKNELWSNFYQNITLSMSAAILNNQILNILRQISRLLKGIFCLGELVDSFYANEHISN